MTNQEQNNAAPSSGIINKPEQASIQTASGDIGSAGRVQEVINNNDNQVINISLGDFIGRDDAVFQLSDSDNIINIDSNLLSGRTSSQISRLRGRLTRLIPIQKQLIELGKLREPSSVLTGFSKFLNTEITLKGIEFAFSPFMSVDFNVGEQIEQNSDSSEKSRGHLKELSEIEVEIVDATDVKKSLELRKQLSSLADEINMAISQANSVFVSFVYSSTSSCELIENINTRIGHQELREEAQMHLGIVTELASKLDPKVLAGDNMDVLSNEAQAAIGVITEIEQRRIIVERLVNLDRGRRSGTAFAVTIYIILIIAFGSRVIAAI